MADNKFLTPEGEKKPGKVVLRELQDKIAQLGNVKLIGGK